MKVKLFIPLLILLSPLTFSWSQEIESFSEMIRREEEVKRVNPKVIVVTTKDVRNQIYGNDNANGHSVAHDIVDYLKEGSHDVSVIHLLIERLDDLPEELSKNPYLKGEDHGPVLGLALVGHGNSRMFALNGDSQKNGEGLAKLVFDSLKFYNRTERLAIYLSACLCGAPFNLRKPNLQKNLLTELVRLNSQQSSWRDFLVIAHPFLVTQSQSGSLNKPWLSVLYHRTGIPYLHHFIDRMAYRFTGPASRYFSLIAWISGLSFLSSQVPIEIFQVDQAGFIGSMILGFLFSTAFEWLNSDFVYLRYSKDGTLSASQVGSKASSVVEGVDWAQESAYTFRPISRCELDFSLF